MYMQKTYEEILRQALTKLSDRTPISAVTPGSVARSIAELVASDLGDFFSILNFNIKQSILSTATGRSLDLWGELYNVRRKTLGKIAADSAIADAFYFYSETPVPVDILIPKNTVISTAQSGPVGDQIAFRTTQDTFLRTGRLRAYVPIVHTSVDSVFAAAPKTLVNHSYTPPNGVTILCTNPKAIAAQVGVESDSDYRVRLIAETRRQAGGTALAIRFTALSINGVRDVVVREAPYGLGSAEIMIIPEMQEATGPLVIEAIRRLEAVKPVGIRLMIKSPRLLHFDAEISLTTKKATSAELAYIRAKAKTAILRFLNELTVGEQLVYNRLVSDIISSDEDIIDVTFTKLQINGSEILRKNYSPQTDGQVVPGAISIS